MDRTFDIYNDIETRTNGDIYIGVVGPVRVGKSTFISKFMDNFVLPNIANASERKRAEDEMPQSSDGKTVMTTQPKFVPSEAVNVSVKNISMRARLIDCVGFMADGALGGAEDKKPRMVKTPWSDEKMPFDQAAKIGTEKVIKDHSTLGIVVTTDGSFGDLPRENFVSAEAESVQTMKASGKPFVVVLNTSKPDAEETATLANKIKADYDVPVLALDVSQLSSNDVENIFSTLTTQFPLNSIDIIAPNWLKALPMDSDLIQNLLGEVVDKTQNVAKIGDYKNDQILFENSDDFESIISSNVDIGKGSITFEIVPKDNLFYKVLSIQSGTQISNDLELVEFIKDLNVAKHKYDQLKSALDSVEETGYGIVVPNVNDMELKAPEIVKQGNRCGIKLRASAPSLHIIKVDVEAEVNPIMGEEQQSADMVEYLQNEFEENPQKLWSTKMFGKSLEEMVGDSLKNKITAVPQGVQNKMRRTMSRIVNEGKGGVICNLL